jgi:hypothetical protein
MTFEDDRTGTWHAYSKSTSNQGQFPAGHNSFRDPHKLAFFKPLSLSGSSSFAGYLAIHFPQVAASIEVADLGVLHLEVAALKAATHEAISKRDWPAVRKHFAFVDSVLEIAETELHDAIGISYLVNLFYNETAINFAKARTLLPKRLGVALEIMERHYEELMFQGHTNPHL